ncbi:MAG TPA: CHAD domain-containing protein [Steroidobacteraceae bacterium]|nr:CHAD domain-containing protein [Steroidobacteraceae bacterium]
MNAAARISVDRKPVHSLQDALLVTLAGTGALRAADDNASIHDARRKLKVARAVLRLLRPALGTRAYRFANREVRDAGRPLRGVRDAVVLLHTLEGLKPATRDGAGRTVLDQLQQRLVANCSTQRRTLTPRRIDRSLRRLDDLGELLRSRPPKVPDLEAAPKGVKKVYRKGRDAYRLACRHPSTEALHEWRKQVKYLHNELKLLKSVYQAGMGRARRTARELAGALGDDHDLAMLREQLRATGPGRQLCRSLSSPIKDSRRDLQATAMKAGKKLYTASPRKFARKLRKSLQQRI